MSVDERGDKLWSTVSTADVLSTAAAKLLAHVGPLQPANENQVLAAFSRRIAPELWFTNETKEMAEESVQQHLGYLERVDEQHFIVSSAPSEPILSLAAAQALNADPWKYASAIETLAHVLVTNRVVTDTGAGGGLVDWMAVIRFIRCRA